MIENHVINVQHIVLAKLPCVSESSQETGSTLVFKSGDLMQETSYKVLEKLNEQKGESEVSQRLGKSQKQFLLPGLGQR